MITVIAEIGINHDGDFQKAKRMVYAAADAGCEMVKFQCHIPDQEYSVEAKDIIPANASESIWDMMCRCAFSEEQEACLKDMVECLGMVYLSTPFSLAAVERLERLHVTSYKIGSGECNNLPLIRMVAKTGKPVILSTGMNDIASVRVAAEILQGSRLAILHCTSEYPTPYEHVRLGALAELKSAFPGATIGLSDHSIGIYTSLAAVALGAEIIEKHFTLDRAWPGPDNVISILPDELAQLITGADAIKRAMGGTKNVLRGERKTAEFAYASVVTTEDLRSGEMIFPRKVTVKRPGGGIPAAELDQTFGCITRHNIPANTQLNWNDLWKN